MIAGLIISAIYWSTAYAFALFYQKNAPNKLLGILPRLSLSIIIWLVVFVIQIFVKEYIFKIPRDRIGPPVSTGPAVISALLFYFFSGSKRLDPKKRAEDKSRVPGGLPSHGATPAFENANSTLPLAELPRKAIADRQGGNSELPWLEVAAVLALIWWLVTRQPVSDGPATAAVSESAVTPQDDKKYYVCITDRASPRVSYTITFANGQESKVELARGQRFIHYSPQEGYATIKFFAAMSARERSIKMRLRDGGGVDCTENGYVFENIPGYFQNIQGYTEDSPISDFDLYRQ